MFPAEAVTISVAFHGANRATAAFEKLAREIAIARPRGKQNVRRGADRARAPSSIVVLSATVILRGRNSKREHGQGADRAIFSLTFHFITMASTAHVHFS